MQLAVVHDAITSSGFGGSPLPRCMIWANAASATYDGLRRLCHKTLPATSRQNFAVTYVRRTANGPLAWQVGINSIRLMFMLRGSEMIQDAVCAISSGLSALVPA